MKGVLFDAEDVLYYRDAETLKPIISLLSKHSYSVSAEQFKDAYEKDKLSLYKGMISKDEHLKKTLEHLHIRPDDAFFHTFRDVFRSAYSEIKVAMGIKQLFKKLQLRGIKIGILTDTFSSEKKKWEWFNKIGLDGHIAAIICSSESGFTKDQKEAYDLGAKKLGLGINDVIFLYSVVCDVIIRNVFTTAFVGEQPYFLCLRRESVPQNVDFFVTDQFFCKSQEQIANMADKHICPYSVRQTLPRWMQGKILLHMAKTFFYLVFGEIHRVDVLRRNVLIRDNAEFSIHALSTADGYLFFLPHHLLAFSGHIKVF